MNELGQFISTVGFPIAVACAVGVAFYKVTRVILEKVIVTFDKITLANDELVKTNSVLVNKLENKMSTIEIKLDKVLNK